MLLIADDDRPIEAVTRIERPMLILHGDADSIIPVRHSRRLAGASPDHVRLVILPGGEHNTLRDTHPEVNQLIKEFFQASALHHLHGEVKLSLIIEAKVMDRHDIRVGELACDLCLFNKSPVSLFVGITENYFHCNLTTDVTIHRPEDCPHPTPGDLTVHNVFALAFTLGEHISDPGLAGGKLF